MIKRTSILLYGIVSYSVFFITFLYAIGFVGNFFVSHTIDGVPRIGLLPALAIDVALLGLFALQHSIMARRVFKRWLTRYIPKPAERSTYVLASSLCLILLFAFWQPLGGVIWSVASLAGVDVLIAVSAFGWLTVLATTFMISHFDLFGLRQVWLQFRDKPYTSLKFGTPWFYRYVRHPLYTGFLLAFWATPLMTVTHLLFAALTTAYVLIAIQLEERDLVTQHGDDYLRYRQHVPMLVPRPGGGGHR